jgi:uncharacterized protein
MIKSGKYENLYTDIAYTLWANEEYLYLLKVLLSDERLRRRVLFGSYFHVVKSAEFEERWRSVRVRAVLGGNRPRPPDLRRPSRQAACRGLVVYASPR